MAIKYYIIILIIHKAINCFLFLTLLFLVEENDFNMLYQDRKYLTIKKYKIRPRTTPRNMIALINTLVPSISLPNELLLSCIKYMTKHIEISVKLINIKITRKKHKFYLILSIISPQVRHFFTLSNYRYILDLQI